MELSKNDVESTVMKSIAAIVADWNVDIVIEPGTRLAADLGFTSMDMIDLLASIETQLNRTLAFEQLITRQDGQYRDEITGGELTSFVWSVISGPDAAVSESPSPGD